MEKFAAILGLIVLLGLYVLMTTQLSPWLKCYSSGCPVSLKDLIKLRGIEKSEVVDAYIMLNKASIRMTWEEIVALRRQDPKIFIKVVSDIINEAKVALNEKA